MRTHSRIIIGHHVVPTLYGHWPPNDPRGSGSSEFYDEKFAPLGPIHHGRRPPQEQPSRAELRAFHRQAEPLLNFPIFWIDDAKRQAIAEAFATVVRGEGYTVYRCAICSNHMHLVIRRHRDTWQRMWEHFTGAAVGALRSFPDVWAEHPVISQRPYARYLYTPEDIRGRIEYVAGNPMKEGLAPQRFDFEVEYDGWPVRKS